MLDLRFFREPALHRGDHRDHAGVLRHVRVYFLFTQYLQFVHGYGPLSAGMRMLPWALAYMFSATQSAKLVERFGQRLVVGSGLVIGGPGWRAGGHEQRDRSYWWFALGWWCRRSAWASRPRRRPGRSCGRCRCTRRASARR